MRIKLQKADRNPKQANYGGKPGGGAWDSGCAKNSNGPIKYKGGAVTRTQKAI